MDFLMFSGPIIGAVIGYFTNYIAVKMLFRPRRAYYLGKRRLPLTPGMIPKRKPALARAVGNAIENQLLTGDDIREALLSQEVKTQLVHSVLTAVEQGEHSLDTIFREGLGDQRAEQCRQALLDFLLERIRHGLGQVDLANLMVEKGKDTLKERMQSNLLGVFLTDRRIDEMAAPLPEEVNRYLDEHLEELLRPVLERELMQCAEMTPGALLQSMKLEEAVLETVLTGLYERIVTEKAEQAVKNLKIGTVVQKKIDGMSSRELEKLVLSVMKKELSAIVNLGALIGFGIGFVNMLIP